MMMTLAIMTMKIMMMMMMMTTLEGRDPRLQQKQPQLPLLLPMPWQQRLFRIFVIFIMMPIVVMVINQIQTDKIHLITTMAETAMDGGLALTVVWDWGKTLALLFTPL